MMKDFNDFLKTLDIEALYDKTASAIDKNGPAELMNMKISTALSINLLRQYHEWLNK